ncbi:MAG: DegV family protein [Candidatus Aquicultor sp.]
MPKIAIVTDSTADMPLPFYKENDITMVPLIVRFGEDTYKDWVEMPPKKFYAMLKQADALPKTSQPSVQDFIEAYEKHAGCDHIISVHLSSKLSGTYQSAYIAAQNVSTPVTVIDSKQASVGTTAIVKELIAARDKGLGLDEMLKIADDLVGKMTLLFYVDTLKYLEMGGRIGKASALVGSILNIKPILVLDDGVVAPFKKVKGRKKINRELIEALKAASDGKRLRICLMHANAPEALEELEALMQQEGLNYELFIKSELGSVIGTYTGPGTIGILFYPIDEKTAVQPASGKRNKPDYDPC